MYWIGVASKDHVQRGKTEGFCQLCHGKSNPLNKMKKNDWLIYYSPKIEFEGNEPYQCFTAIGQVFGEQAYQVEMFPGFKPFRRDIKFYDSLDLPIRPLIEQLEFIKDKKKWGYSFRFGHFQISSNDFELISTKMLLQNEQFA